MIPPCCSRWTALRYRRRGTQTYYYSDIPRTCISLLWKCQYLFPISWIRFYIQGLIFYYCAREKVDYAFESRQIQYIQITCRGMIILRQGKCGFKEGGGQMPNKQAVMQCVQTCTQAANDLRSAANGVNNAGIRDMLTQGAHHVELCIRQCEGVLQKP